MLDNEIEHELSIENRKSIQTIIAISAIFKLNACILFKTDSSEAIRTNERTKDDGNSTTFLRASARLSHRHEHVVSMKK